MELVIRLKGGSGSGNFGHAGRPGEVGGSATDYGLVWAGKPSRDLEQENARAMAGVVVTPKEKRALKNYKYGEIDNGYLMINRGLREGTVPSDDVAKSIAGIDSAMNNNILNQDYVVYRGVDSSFSSHIKEGFQFTDRGYPSTSLSVNRPLNLANTFGWGPKIQGAIFRLTIPAGSHGVFMDGIVKGMFEYELLLPRGGRFTIGRDITADVPRYLSGLPSDSDLPRIFEVSYEPNR